MKRRDFESYVSPNLYKICFVYEYTKELNYRINIYYSPYASKRVKGMAYDQRKIHRRD
jgi:hypothetical protein